jgi:DNA polymerase (family 10)
VRNNEVAHLLYELADLSDYVDDSPFKSRAYRQAARLLETMQTPIETLAEQGQEALEAVPGIGKAIAEKIRAYLETGVIPKHQQLLAQVPPGILEVMAVPGIGPKTARLLAEHLGVRDLESLQRALESPRVLQLPGFGEQKRQRLLHLLDLVKKSRVRRPLGSVLWLGRERLEWLRQLPGVRNALLGGSVRRMQETVGDLDYLVATEQNDTVIDAFLRMPGVIEVYSRGENRAQVFLSDGLQVDLKLVPPDSWGAGMLYITGSKAHSIRLRERAIERGLKLNEYGVWRGSERIASHTEEEVYAALGLPWIPPTLREDQGEIEAAERGTLPTLIQLEQVRGDLQVHSTWSDGRGTIEQLVRVAQELGYEYLALTDHIEMLVWHGELREVFRRRQREIEQLNERLGGKPYLLNGLEVNIEADGQLAAPDDLLRSAEIVVAGVHHAHGQPADIMTRRLIRALEHPAVQILAHPTGRRFGKRESNEADWERIFMRAAQLGKAIEVNGYYTRMDPPTPLVRLLNESGAPVALGTDAHTASDLRYMELAVGLAQRGWLRPERILNTRPLRELQAWLQHHREVRA